MGEGVEGYPPWEGSLTASHPIATIIKHEIKRTWEDLFGLIAIVLVAATALFMITSLQVAGPSAHTLDRGLRTLNLLRWGPLGLAAIMAGPALLEDRLHGALELYLSRAMTTFDYLAGKIGAVYGMSALALIGPGLLYWIVSFFIFETQPDHWMRFPAGVVLYGLIWATFVSGLGLGLASVSDSSAATGLTLFGGVAIADVFISNVLSGVAATDALRVISPFAMLGQQVEWIFQGTNPYDFPYWWGLLGLAVLSAVGWLLVWRFHPRLEGVEA